MDPSLFDLSPPTRHYAWTALWGSIISTDSERTISATPMVPTPSSPPCESGGTTSTPVVIAAVVSATTTVQEDETIPIAAEETPGGEEVHVHISDIPEGNVVVDKPVDENHVVGSHQLVYPQQHLSTNFFVTYDKLGRQNQVSSPIFPKI